MKRKIKYNGKKKGKRKNERKMLVKQEYCTAFPVICVRPVRQVMTDNNRHRMEWNGAMRIEPIELLSIHCFFCRRSMHTIASLCSIRLTNLNDGSQRIKLQKNMNQTKPNV